MTASAVLVLNCGSSSVKFALVDPASGERPSAASPSASVPPRPACSVDAGATTRTSARRRTARSHGASWRTCWPPSPGRGACDVSAASGTGWCTAAAVLRLGRRRRRRALATCATWPTWRRCTSRPTWPASSAARARAARTAAGRGVRHRLPPDHAAGRLPLRRAERVVRRARRPPLRLPRHQPPLTSAPAPPSCWAGRLTRCGWSRCTWATAAAPPPSGTAESVDTTMGLTPLEGLVMGTRSGDVDPGLLGYVAERLDLDLDGVLDALNTRSGLLGAVRASATTCAPSCDAAARGLAADAALALEVFATARPSVGALAVAARPARRPRLHRRHRRAQRRGAQRDAGPPRPAGPARGPARPTPATGATPADGSAGPTAHPVALVVPTDEELLIARDTA